jgi:hypothetical protein
MQSPPLPLLNLQLEVHPRLRRYNSVIESPTRSPQA